MHCIESLQGSYRNAIIDAFSVRADCSSARKFTFPTT